MKTISLIFIFISLVPNLLCSQGWYFIPFDSIFFESNSIPYEISQEPGNCWQVGHPSKSYFDVAYSPPLAIVTDTLLPYPTGTTSSFIIRFSTFEYPASGFEFIHKYDSDTLTDFGTVEGSYDHGQTWEVLRDSFNYTNNYIMSYWDPDLVCSNYETFPHVLHPSGHSNGWIRSRFSWIWMLPVKQNGISDPPDSIYVRFTFHSDDIQTNKEGWMIDNIWTGIVDVGGGISTPGEMVNVSISPNPLTAVSKVQCSKVPQGSFFELYDIRGRLILKRNISPAGSLDLNRSDLYPGLFIWKVTSGANILQIGKLIVQ